MSAVNSLNAGPAKKKPGARARLTTLLVCNFLGSLLLFIAASAASSQSAQSILPGPKPDHAPSRWKPFIGTYENKTFKKTALVLETDGRLAYQFLDPGAVKPILLSEGPLPGDRFEVELAQPRIEIRFDRDAAAKVIALHLPDGAYRRIDPPVADSSTQRLESIERLRAIALSVSAPKENRTFRKSDLVELEKLDRAIHLDIRYATANDFLGVPVYTQARAFLQRPAAEALVRVLHKLEPLGYGLLIHDGYRPWYVTKIFWDATPAEGKIFVADPAQGSRHNRGCAVDLTLYDLKTGAPIEMTGDYDEMSSRSFPNYPGGTSLERWHRDLLRRAMESEGFTVYESEWWHFDYKDWPEYGILNIPFEKLGVGSEPK